jgi:hypothetical protein
MALGDSYATLTELKNRLGITDSIDDTALTAALSTASRGIEFCTHRQFNDAGAASARVYYVSSPRKARIDDFHTIAGLVIETDEGSDGTFETTWSSVTDYELHPLNGIVDGVPGWPYWELKAVDRWFPICVKRASLRVTARWGWASVPAPVKEGCLILAEDVFKLKDTAFGAGGYGEYGRIKARENPNVWLRIAPYVRDAVLVA